jgi:oligopeptide transport system substrate-binding protein
VVVNLRKRFLATLGAVGLIVVACGGAASPAPSGDASAPASGGASAAPSAGASGALAAEQVLRLYVGATDPRSIEPQAASGTDEVAVIGALHRGLLYYDKDLNLVPSVATALPTVSADGLTVTFTLGDFKYADGTNIVAGDFVRAAQRLADPRSAFDYGYQMCWLAGSDELMGTDFCGVATPTPDVTDNALIDGLLAKLGATAPDDKTVVFTLKQPVSFFNNIAAMWLMAPVKEEWTKWDDPSGFGASGPFMMESWTHNSEMVLVPNPNWYGTKPTIAELHLMFGGDPEAAVASYERGDLDTVWVPSTSARRVLDDPNLSPMVKDVPSLAINYYDFATCQNPPEKCPASTGTASGRSPTENKNFRIALSQAVDKAELAEVAYAGLVVPAAGPVVAGIPGWPDDYNPYPFDVAAAQAAMATALTELGVVDGADEDTTVGVTDVGTLKFGYNCDAGHQPRVLYLANAWRDNLGFSESQLDISCTDFGVFRTERRDGGIYSISRNGWIADFPHPDNQLRDLFACGSALNNSHWCNPAFDELLGKGAAEADAAASKQFYVDAQRMMVDDAPVVFLGQPTNRYMIQPYVAGLQPTGKDGQNIGDLFYESIQILEH